MLDNDRFSEFSVGNAQLLKMYIVNYVYYIVHDCQPCEYSGNGLFLMYALRHVRPPTLTAFRCKLRRVKSGRKKRETMRMGGRVVQGIVLFDI